MTTILIILQREFLVVMRDYDSKIGADCIEYDVLSSCVGKYELGQRNKNKGMTYTVCSR